MDKVTADLVSQPSQDRSNPLSVELAAASNKDMVLGGAMEWAGAGKGEDVTGGTRGSCKSTTRGSHNDHSITAPKHSNTLGNKDK